MKIQFPVKDFLVRSLRVQVSVTLLFTSIWAIYVFADFRSGANLSFVHLRSTEQSDSGQSSDQRVVAYSVFGNAVELVQWRPGEWELPEGLARRQLARVVIQFHGRRTADHARWQLSRSMTARRNWEPVSLVESSIGWEVCCESSPGWLHRWLRKPMPMNWGGDLRLFAWSFAKSFLFVWVCLLSFRFASTAYGAMRLWLTRESNSKEFYAVVLNATQLRPFDKIILGALVISITVAAVYRLHLSTKTLWPGLHEDACMYSSVPLNIVAGEGY